MVVEVGVDGVVAALGLGERELVSLVGGGGKTTMLFRLGRDRPGRTILTTTTKMGRDRTDGVPVLIDPSDDEIVSAFDDAARSGRSSTVLVWGGVTDRKAVGVAPEHCDAWLDIADTVVVEADGSRQRPFKAPRPLEPVVPGGTTTLVACIGADALDRVIADQCQRPLRVAAIAGCRPYERLTPDRAAVVLSSERGSRKDCPIGARFVVVVTKVDDGNRDLVVGLAQRLAPLPTIAVAAHAR